MNASRRQRVVLFATLPGVCLLALFVVWHQTRTDGRGRIIKDADFEFYVPPGIEGQSTVPLVVGLSPGGNPDDVMLVWEPVADRFKWIVMASWKFRNGEDPTPVFEKIKEEIESGVRGLPVDRKRIIATGLSGGGMGSHALAYHYPELFSGVVVNTGMMNEFYLGRASTYPRGKLAVFLASHKDFRYQEMHRDKAFLDSLGWKTHWIEFEGGHRLAPISTYEQAAGWLKEQWGGREEVGK
jgi:predicted esterase